MSDPDIPAKNVFFLIDERPLRQIGGGDNTGGGGPPTDMEKRLNALEEGHKLIVGKLGEIADGIKDLRHENEKRFSAIDNRLTAIEIKLDTKAAKTDLTPIEVKLAHVDGRMANIPTFWQTFFLILGAIITTVGSLAGLGAVFAKFMKP